MASTTSDATPVASTTTFGRPAEIASAKPSQW